MKNIVWLIPDGVRSVEFNDSLGKFKSFETLKQDGFIEFKNMYTTAPSTFMSFSAFLSGIHSTQMADKYGVLKTLKNQIPTIEKYLTDYNKYIFTWHADLKAMLNTFGVVDVVDNKKEFLEWHLNYDDVNRDIDFINNLKNLKEPFMLFVHIASKDLEDLEERLNYDFNQEFNNLYQNIKKNVDENNTCFIVHSDHGFPVSCDENIFVAHDKYISQDNIKIPFYIKIPNVKSEDIYTFTSLIDVIPTLNEVLNIGIPTEFLDGVNLIDIINGKKPDRALRIDNRFPNQENVQTALIYNYEKLVYNYDLKQFKLYKIDDSINEKEIEVSKEWIERFNRLNEEFNHKRDIIYKTIHSKKEVEFEEFLGKEIDFVVLDKNEYIDNFIENRLQNKKIFFDGIENNNFPICFIYSSFDKDKEKYLDSINKVLALYNFDNIYFLDSYLNIDTVKKEYCIDYFENKFAIFNRKKYRDSRKDNSVLKNTKDEYFELWKKKTNCKGNKW